MTPHTELLSLFKSMTGKTTYNLPAMSGSGSTWQQSRVNEYAFAEIPE